MSSCAAPKIGECPWTAAEITQSQSEGLPPGWADFFCPASQKRYYHNAVTKETTWVRPGQQQPPREHLRDDQYMITITKDRCGHWTVEMAIDEFVQNWRDECDKAAEHLCDKAAELPSTTRRGTRTEYLLCTRNDNVKLGRLIYDEQHGSLELTNYNAQLLPKCFLDGVRGDDKKLGKRRGKFGDGLPSATAVFLNHDVTLWITSCAVLWHFAFKANPQFGESCLCIKTRRPGSIDDPRRPSVRTSDDSFQEATDVSVRICLGKSNAFQPKRYIFLNPPGLEVQTFYGDLLLEQAFKG